MTSPKPIRALCLLSGGLDSQLAVRLLLAQGIAVQGVTFTSIFFGAKAAERADTWMVGDNHTDIAAAHRAGVHSIFVTYGMGTLGPEKPEVTAAGFDEVVRMFVD